MSRRANGSVNCLAWLVAAPITRNKSHGKEPELEKAIEELYEQDATLGRRRMPVLLKSRYGISIGAKKCHRLKKKLGLRSLYPHHDTSKPNPRAEKEPYLLKNMEINEADQVWTSDITYIQIEQRNHYL
jgi:putative transposase